MAAEDWDYGDWADWDGPDFEPPSCADCGAHMTLEDSPFKPGARYWRCSRYPECRGAHGAHPNGAPMGEPADAETRVLRIRAHEVFDPLWRDAPLLYGERALDPRESKKLMSIAKRRAYDWLEHKLDGENPHIGSADRATCHRIIFICSRATAATVRAWAKRQGS